MDQDNLTQPINTNQAQMDIRPVRSSIENSPSRKILIISSIVLVILAIVFILLKIKARHDYLKTPMGRLETLEKNSAPVTKSLEERYAQMNEGQKYFPTTRTEEDNQSDFDALVAQ